MKRITFLMLAMSICIFTFAQQQKYSSYTNPEVNTIRDGGIYNAKIDKTLQNINQPKAAADAMWNIDWENIDGLANYMLIDEQQQPLGYWSGHNVYGWSDFAEAFEYSGQGTVTNIYCIPADVTDEGGSITFKIWADEAGTPGTVLGTQVVNLADLAMDVVNQIELDEPIAINGNFYVGYEVNYPNMSITDMFAVYQEVGTSDSFYIFTGTEWGTMNDLTTGGVTAALAMGVEIGMNTIDGTEIKMDAISDIPASALINDVITIGGTAKNLGSDAITTFTASYSVNGGTPVTQEFTDVALAATGDTYEFVFTEELTLATAEATTVEVSVTTTGDQNANNNSLSQNIFVASELVQKVVFLENFSSSSCGPCNAPNAALKEQLNSVDPSVYTLIKYQMSWPGTGDPYYTEEGNEKRDFYGIDAVPSFYINGAEASVPSAATINALADAPAKIKLEADESIVENKTISNTLTVTPVSSGDYTNIRIFAAIIENKTFNNVSTNGETEFMHVMKKFITSPNGDELGTMTVGTPIEVPLTYTFNGNYRLPANAYSPIDHATEHSVEEFHDLRIVYWVQDIVTGEVWQAGTAETAPPTVPTGTLLGFAHNFGTIALGETATSATFTLTNIGTDGLTITSVSGLEAPFTSTIDNSINLNSDATHDFTFTFAPTTGGQFENTVAIETNGGTFNVSLTGTGRAPITEPMTGDFETNVYDFDLDFFGWTQHDVDGGSTYGFTGVEFLNSGYTGSFIAFNPTDLGLTATAFEGDRFGACFASVPQTITSGTGNNDWLITPQSEVLEAGAKFKAQVKTGDELYPEQYAIWVSTTDTEIASFEKISAGASVFAPTTWTAIEYSLADYAGEQVYVAIQVVSNDCFWFQIDNIEIVNEEGATYTVTFDANGGEGTMAAQTFTEGVADALTMNDFTRTDYTFEGWATTATGSVMYADGANYTATADATLYAVWDLASSIEDDMYNSVNIYPNPANSMITIANAENANIVIMNIIGEVVTVINSASSNQTIDVSNYAAGTYFVKVNSKTVKFNVVK